MENKKFIIAMLVNNKHGVLTRIAGLFAKRAYNIDNLSVGKTDDPTISRMTIVTECDESIKDQIIKQLDKLIDVNNVQIMEDSSTVSRELMLIKIRIEDGIQTSVMEAINVFRAKVIDMSENSIIVEITGPTEKLNAFIQYMKKYGIMELSRTGLTAMERGSALLSLRSV
ncbi:MAG: acetolactate synthase small subunit [Christensenellales bacterium]|jgi:acetolactate synthase-1/3 small subunit